MKSQVSVPNPNSVDLISTEKGIPVNVEGVLCVSIFVMGGYNKQFWKRITLSLFLCESQLDYSTENPERKKFSILKAFLSQHPRQEAMTTYKKMEAQIFSKESTVSK